VEKILNAGENPIKLFVKETNIPRYEDRVLYTIRSLWETEMNTSSQTEWFLILDDDTFFLDMKEFVYQLSKYNKDEELMIGAPSEWTWSVDVFGRFPFGGAGVAISRKLLLTMNENEKWRECWESNASITGWLGGDSRISRCARLAAVRDPFVEESGLHQMDLYGDVSGFLQSGLSFLSLHHWNSWNRIFPDRSDHPLDQAFLVGKAAQSIGNGNWGRRLVLNEGKILITLGYSITLYKTPVDYTLIESTWGDQKLFLPTRPAMAEITAKTTYYLDQVSVSSNGVLLTHVNRYKEIISILWEL